jgi:large subunit ribosomal protein L30
MIKVSLKRSLIGIRKDIRATVEALGLKKTGDVREVVDNESTRGMLRKVEHLVTIEGQDQQ